MTPDPNLKFHTIALVGLMGVGKTTVGRRLANALSLPFRDADEEIEKAAGRSVGEIFAERGENEFRMGEHRVISRLIANPPLVLATGGGALTHPETLALLKDKTLMVWLKADLELLSKRVSRNNRRPLIRGRDPMDVLKIQAEARYPLYQQAHICVETGDVSHQAAVQAVLEALTQHLAITPTPGSIPTTASIQEDKIP